MIGVQSRPQRRRSWSTFWQVGTASRPFHHPWNASSDLSHCLSSALYNLGLLCVFHGVSFDALLHVSSHQSWFGRARLSAKFVHRILCDLIESKVVSYGVHWNLSLLEMFRERCLQIKLIEMKTHQFNGFSVVALTSCVGSCPNRINRGTG